MNLNVSSPCSLKKATRPGLERRGPVPQSPRLQCPHRRGTRDCRGETVPYSQRCLAPNQRGDVGYGHGDGVRLASSPHKLSSSAPHIRRAELDQLWLNPIMSFLIHQHLGSALPKDHPSVIAAYEWVTTQFEHRRQMRIE